MVIGGAIVFLLVPATRDAEPVVKIAALLGFVAAVTLLSKLAARILVRN